MGNWEADVLFVLSFMALPGQPSHFKMRAHMSVHCKDREAYR